MICNSEQIEQAVAELLSGKDPDGNFRLIFECYRAQVFNFFAKRNFSPEQCRDLTQIVFIRVYTGMADFRREAPFGAWLFQIAANVYRDNLRSRTTQKRAGHTISLDGADDDDDGAQTLRMDLPDLSSQSQPLETVLGKERQRLLCEALMRLPEQMRKCMILRVHQELSYKEIAVLMRLSVETVKVHLYQARKKLEADMAAYYGESSI